MKQLRSAAPNPSPPSPPNGRELVRRLFALPPLGTRPGDARRSPKSPDLASLAQTLTAHLTRGLIATVAINGHSGSGKSLLLSGVAQRLAAAGVTVIRCDLLRQRPTILRAARPSTPHGRAAAPSPRSGVLWRASAAAPGATLLCDLPLAPSDRPSGRPTPPTVPSSPGSHAHLQSNSRPAAPRDSTPCQSPDTNSPALLWLSCLSKVGLAEARILLTPVCKLSTGQRARYRLACALLLAEVHHERHPSVPIALVIDEFASGLDAVTSASLGPALLRWQASPDGSGPKPPHRLLVIAGTVDVPGVDLRLELGSGPGLTSPIPVLSISKRRSS